MKRGPQETIDRVGQIASQLLHPLTAGLGVLAPVAVDR